jgi:hypothetical protein
VVDFKSWERRSFKVFLFSGFAQQAERAHIQVLASAGAVAL